MNDKDDLIRRLCTSLAYHTWETTATGMMAVPELPPECVEKIEEARALIREAGFEFDDLLPPEDQWEPTPVHDMPSRVM